MLILQDALNLAVAHFGAHQVVEAITPLGNSPWYCELMPWLRMCR